MNPPQKSAQAIWGPETLYATWLSASFLLMTIVLIFYHMTRINSLKMNFILAGIFATSLSILSVIFILFALITYFLRVNKLLENEKSNEFDYEYENSLKYVYLITGIIILFIQSAITIAIITGTYQQIFVHKRPFSTKSHYNLI
jgi:heme/copper-type cytochrome/quinol oxidase subunit 2